MRYAAGRFIVVMKPHRMCGLLVAAIAAVLVSVALGCTAPEPPPSPPTEPPQVAVVLPTHTATPAPTATDIPPTPTLTPVPTDTPVPPTNTPAPTFTPRPSPTDVPEPTPTRTPRPTPTPRPSSTPAPPSPIAALENGDWLDRNKRPLAMEIRSLPWVADGVDESEREATELLIAAARWYPAVFNALMAKPWVGDGVTPAETDAIFGFRWMPRYADGLVEQVLVLPWTQDGITAAEGKTITYIYRNGRYSRELADRLMQKLWLQDGVTADEATVIQYLYWTLRVPDETQQPAAIEATVQILNMPFLEQVAGADAAALRSLERLGDAGVDVLLDVMSHPNLAEGITDDDAKIVALLGGTYSYRPESVDFLLRGTGVYLEERVIELPLSGEVLLTIIRIRDQVTPSMDFLEHSVRTTEKFMGMPLPTNYIALYFDDANVRPGGGQGTNYASHMAMSLDYDVENGWRWEYAPFVIAHEVAHYYWRHSSRDWLDEGPAELLGSISEKARVDEPVEVTNNPCASAETIAELESIAEKLETWTETVQTNWFQCNYSLGEQIFLDLYNSLGEETFRQGFRNLYLKSQAEDYSDDCEGTDLGICHLVAAFKAGVSEADGAKVDEAAERWYGPLP